MKALRWILASPFLLLIHLYRLFLSPILHLITGPLGGCRFEPTCSKYALEALHTHHLFRALWLILCRVGRCHPWGGSGYDPVPEPKAGEPQIHTDERG